MTSGNFAHNVAYIKQNLMAFNSLNEDFAKQADIDLDALSKADDFHYVMDMFDNAFPVME